MGGGDTEA
jgi:hypothetical protein